MSEPTKPAPLPLGTVWEIPAKDVVIVTRPDGSYATVQATDGHALYVLDEPGEFTATLVDRTGKAHVVEAG